MTDGGYRDGPRPAKKSRFDPAKERTSKSSKAALTEAFDTSLYDRESNKFDGYNASIAVNDDDDAMDVDDSELNGRKLVGQYTASKEILNEFAHGDTEEADILMSREEKAQIASRETDYQKRRFARALSPNRADPFKNGEGEDQGATYKDVMKARELEREEARVKRILEQRQLKGEDGVVEHQATLKEDTAGNRTPPVEGSRRKRRRWDDGGEADGEQKEVQDKEKEPQDKEKKEEAQDKSVVQVQQEEPKKQSRWNIGPAPAGEVTVRKSSRFDQAGAAPAVPRIGDATPAPVAGLASPAPVILGFGADAAAGGLTDEYLDQLLPGPEEGYAIFNPKGGVPVRPANVLPVGYTGYMMPDQESASLARQAVPKEIPGVGDLQFFKEQDMQYFGKLVDGANESEMSFDELRERKIMRLLLKVKNGTPPMRKTALRQITDNARAFGPGPLFDQLLPLLMERSLEDQERHLLVKVIDRCLYKLDELVRPYVHKILVVIEPLLIDQDYYARVEGKEIISNLAKAAGLTHMISVMRPDLDHPDEYVRNTTARAFAVVASALGIPALLPFLKAVCRSKKSWEARHTGVKIVQQIPIHLGCAVLPYLKPLIETIGENLNDDNPKVRMVTALAIAALAEASYPYGIESFEHILNPLWTGARKQRGRALATFLKAVGYLVTLMDEEYASYYTSQIMEILIREFHANDDDMKKVVLKVVSQCSKTRGVTPSYLQEEVLPEFFKAFWVRRMALDRRNSGQVIATTVDLANKVGVLEIVRRLSPFLKDDSEPYRKMVIETLDKVVGTHGLAGLSEREEEQLVDGILVAYQEQTAEDPIILDGFATIITSLDIRAKGFLPQIVSSVLYRIANKAPSVRQQAADLISRLTKILSVCQEDVLLNQLSKTLSENLGEEYPEVLGSFLSALRAIVNVVGIYEMDPPVKDLLPQLTPILRNRHEKVQENTIDLVGRIADRAPEMVNPREWMRITFELLDMLKAHKKGIRRAANNTFGFIAKAVGPQDVLSTLLANLRVSERQSRVCTAVAIGIVAETCSPFTVLPALMNEYRVPELNVQNGVLKALSFMFEYVGDMGKDYVYTVITLLEDALIDRDQVHRQTAASVVKHMALGAVGYDCEDAMIHLLNLLWPNIFETSPHVIDRVIEAIDGIRNAVGNPIVMNHVWPGLFHSARKVRQPYWRVYNDAYVQHADALVPCYPDFDDEKLRRHELDIFI